MTAWDEEFRNRISTKSDRAISLLTSSELFVDWFEMAKRKPRRQSRYFKIKVLRALKAIQIGHLAIQSCLYCLVLCLGIGATVVGADLMISLISIEMAEIGNDIAKSNLPAEVETASLRPTIRW